LKGDWLCNALLLLAGENASLMARKEGVQRAEWGSKGGCECEEEEEGFMERFHLDCFPFRGRCEGRKARPAPAKEMGVE